MRSSRIDPHDLDMVSYYSDPVRRARNAMLNVDLTMQNNYSALKAELINQLSPVIVVENGPSGGKYTLIYNGMEQSTQPVGEIFMLAKSIAHTPLGTYSLVAPYLKNSNTDDWIAPLQNWRNTLTTALAALPNADIPQELQTSSTNILEGAINFIDNSISSESFSIESFDDFTASVYDSVRINMFHAAITQITGVKALMTKWRDLLGEDWKKLYVVVLSIWTTSVLNQNSIIIKTFMDPETVESHLIDLPTAETPSDPVFTALDNLARIVQDNVAAEMIFCTDRETADALKGPQDLLSEEILKLLDTDLYSPLEINMNKIDKLVCPKQSHLAKHKSHNKKEE